MGEREPDTTTGPAPEPTSPHADLGLTHVALTVADLDRSIDFYARFADMVVVHRREDHEGSGVVWLSDLTRAFVVVLIRAEVTHPLGGSAHLGVACADRAVVDARLAAATAEGHRVVGPHDDGPPVGYWGMIVDPDGHNLELAFGQEVGVTVAEATSPA